MQRVAHLLFIFFFLGFVAACGGGGGSGDRDIFGNALDDGNGLFCNSSLAPPSSRPTTGQRDSLIDAQWYLDRLSIKQAWGAGHDGTGIQIGIVDSGVEIAHEDLKNNVATNKSLNFVSYNRDNVSRNNPIPERCSKGHGTAVAGIIAAEGDNGLGIKGIAFRSKIFGTNFLARDTDSTLRISLAQDMERTAISSNSWGEGPVTRLRGERTWEAISPAVRSGVEMGFGGTGISYVFAGGNDRNVSATLAGINLDPPDSEFPYPYEDLATYERHLNQPEIIPVCAVGFDDVSAAYSSRGANLWVCGPSNTGQRVSRVDPNRIEYIGLPTTDISGAGGYNARRYKDIECSSPEDNRTKANCRNFGRAPNPGTGIPNPLNYHRSFSGTSAAVPIVSGIIALMRGANPRLTWRDVKLILAETAEQVDSTNSGSFGLGWQSAGEAIGDSSKRYTHHHDYGFGLVNALAAVTLAASWSNVGTAKKPISVEGDFIGGNRVTRFTIGNSNDEDITFIEYVQVRVQSDHINFGELKIELLSPDGTRSRLANPHNCLLGKDRSIRPTKDCTDLRNGFTFGSAAHLGEEPGGIWELTVIGNNNDHIQPTDTARIFIYGH